MKQPNHKIHALLFEPVPHVFKDLERKFRFNSSVQTIQGLVDADSATRKFYTIVTELEF